MNNKLLYVSDDGASYEAHVDAAAEVVELHYTQNHLWAPDIRGELAATFEDYGNGVTICFSDGKVVNLDYSEFGQLEMLFTCIKKDVPHEWSRQYGLNYDRYELKND